MSNSIYTNIKAAWSNWNDADKFSGVLSIRIEEGIILEKCCGFRNRSEALPNTPDTAFGIASGTKLFTGLALCKLLDEGKLSLDDRLWDLLPYDLGEINKGVTIRHLLTHSSGIGDYIDEEATNACESEQETSEKYPVYLWERLDYYLQMITPLPQKFEPGARFGYSNAGFIMLGLVIEAISKKPYQQYVTDEIITPLNLRHTGFYPMNALPANTAYGYMEDDKGMWRTNIFRLPIVGGSDGGLFTCAGDLDLLWRALFDGRILSEGMLEAFLKSQIARTEEKSYGLGVYRIDRGSSTAYYAVGSDFGVDFFTAYFPKEKITASMLGNTEMNTYPVLDTLFSVLL